jgi:hypothetical protein
MRGFRTDAITAPNLRANGLEYASEMNAQAAATRLRISEIPINLARSTRDGNQSTPTTRPHGLRHVGTFIALPADVRLPTTKWTANLSSGSLAGPYGR